MATPPASCYPADPGRSDGTRHPGRCRQGATRAQGRRSPIRSDDPALPGPHRLLPRRVPCLSDDLHDRPQFQSRSARRVRRMGRTRSLHRAADHRQELPRPQFVPALGRDLEQHPVGGVLRQPGDLHRAGRGRPGQPGPLRIGHHGHRLHPAGDRGHGPGDHLELRVRARYQHRPAQRHPGRRSRTAGSHGSATRTWSTAR